MSAQNRNSTVGGSGRILLLLLLVFSLCPACTESGGEKKPSNPAGAVPVDIVPVEPRTFHETVRGIGSLEAGETIEIRPELSGILEKIHVKEGEGVERGDRLFTLEGGAIQKRLDRQRRALDAAEARLEKVRSTHARLEALWKNRVIAEERWDEVQSELEVSRANVGRLRSAVEVVLEELENTFIRSPASGVLSEVLVDEGDFVRQGQRLVTLYMRSGMEAAFRVSGLHAGRVRVGQEARVQVGAYPDTTFSGRVSFVSPDMDPGTRDFLVKATVDQEEDLLKPGMFAGVSVVLDRREGSPSVPEETLVPTREGYSVFVLEEGHARKRSVKIGIREPGRVEILEGLEPGERVVRKGHLTLGDGDRVEIRRKAGDDEG